MQPHGPLDMGRETAVGLEIGVVEGLAPARPNETDQGDGVVRPHDDLAHDVLDLGVAKDVPEERAFPEFPIG